MNSSSVHAAVAVVSMCLFVSYCVLQLSTSKFVGLGSMLPYVPAVRYPTQRLRVPPNLHKTLHQCRKPLVVSTITDIVTLAAFLQSDWDSTAQANQCLPLSLVNQTVVAISARQPSPLCYCMQRHFSDYMLFTMVAFREWDSNRDPDAQPVEPVVDLAVWQRHVVDTSNAYKLDVYAPAVEACIRSTRVVVYDMVWGNYNVYYSTEGVLTLLAYVINMRVWRAHDALAVRSISKNVPLLSALVHKCMVGLLIPTLLITGLGQCVLLLCYFASLAVCESAVLLTRDPRVCDDGSHAEYRDCAGHSWKERVRIWHHQTVLVALLCVLHNLTVLYMSVSDLVCDVVFTGSAVALVYVVRSQGTLLSLCVQQYAKESIRSSAIFNGLVCVTLVVCKGLWVEGSHLDLMGLRSRGAQIWILKVLYVIMALVGDAVPNLFGAVLTKGRSTCACMDALRYSTLLCVAELGLLLYLSALYLTALYT
jgi:hypothetical protein